MRTQSFLITAATTGSLLLASTQVLGNQFVTGQTGNGNVTLNSAVNWITLRSATVTIPAGDTKVHGCTVVASADMDFNGPAGVENQYLFVLSRNNSNPVTNTGSERMLELVDNSTVNDPDVKPVSTTDFYTNVRNNNGVNGTGSHTFYFLGRKVEAGDTNADVLDASLSVSCIHTP